MADDATKTETGEDSAAPVVDVAAVEAVAQDPVVQDPVVHDPALQVKAPDRIRDDLKAWVRREIELAMRGHGIEARTEMNP